MMKKITKTITGYHCDSGPYSDDNCAGIYENIDDFVECCACGKKLCSSCMFRIKFTMSFGQGIYNDNTYNEMYGDVYLCNDCQWYWSSSWLDNWHNQWDMIESVLTSDAQVWKQNND